jgi:hypothetical protein
LQEGDAKTSVSPVACDGFAAFLPAKTSVSPVACDGFAAFLPAKAVAAMEHVRGAQRERSLSHGYARMKEEGTRKRLTRGGKKTIPSIL